MKIVHSQDGTPIAFDQLGQGKPLILVSGALGVRSHPMFTRLVELLKSSFTVFNYDRRGRGDSGNTPSYAVEREVEDIEALIDAVSGLAFVYGIFSGAVLALETASRLPTKVERLALYEPPFILDTPPLPKDYVEQLNQAIAVSNRSAAVDIFMTKALCLPDAFLAAMHNEPMWAEMEAVAHTLVYDGMIMGDTMSGNPLPSNRWVFATMSTLVMSGAASEAFLQYAAQALVNILPNAQYSMLPGQGHDIAAEALAPVLVEFFSAVDKQAYKNMATRGAER